MRFVYILYHTPFLSMYARYYTFSAESTALYRCCIYDAVFRLEYLIRSFVSHDSKYLEVHPKVGTQNVQKHPKNTDFNFGRHPGNLSAEIHKTGIKCISETQIQHSNPNQKLPDFLEELQETAEKAFGENAHQMIESLFCAKMPPHLKKSINQAYLENGSYDQFVKHLEREMELNGLKTDEPSSKPK